MMMTIRLVAAVVMVMAMIMFIVIKIIFINLLVQPMQRKLLKWKRWL